MSDTVTTESAPVDLGKGASSTDPAPRPRKGPRRRPRRLRFGRLGGIIGALAVICVYLGVTEPIFATWGNITNVVQSNSVILVLAVGATFVIIAGGLDLSTASAMVLASMVMGLVLQANLGTTATIVLTLAAGVGMGLVNGILISYLKISFLVVTLGTLSIFASVALVIADGKTITTFGLAGFDPIYQFSLGKVAGIPYLLLFDIAIVLVGAAVLRYTAFGRSVFAVGSNREAARLNGINVAFTTMMIYVVAGLAASIASVLSVGRLTAASPTVDSTLLLTVVAAVLIGGTAYTGGEGGLLGTVVGVVFLGVIQNGLTLASVSTYWRGSVNGVVLIVAVGVGVLHHSGLRHHLTQGLRARRSA